VEERAALSTSPKFDYQVYRQFQWRETSSSTAYSERKESKEKIRKKPQLASKAVVQVDEEDIVPEGDEIEEDSFD
jgi:hypothetical protein